MILTKPITPTRWHFDRTRPYSCRTRVGGSKVISPWKNTITIPKHINKVRNIHAVLKFNCGLWRYSNKVNIYWRMWGDDCWRPRKYKSRITRINYVTAT